MQHLQLKSLSINFIKLRFQTITPLFCFQAAGHLEVKFLTNDARKQLAITLENIPQFVLTKLDQTWVLVLSSDLLWVKKSGNEI